MVMRLDKFLAHAGLGTRSEVKKIIRSGRVLLNGVAAKRPEDKVDEGMEVLLDGKIVSYAVSEYYMLNKPKGVVSASRDKDAKTVVDYITCPHAKDLFPAGRLDKDTEGLLLLTNDGPLAHELLSPKKHVEKVYQVWVEGMVTAEDQKLFGEGLDIGDGKKTRPAKLEKISYYDGEGRLLDFDGFEAGSAEIDNLEKPEENRICQTRLEITITEGRYHQIKRMFGKVGKSVQYLRRVSMGNLVLDEGLEPGGYRSLTEEEIFGLKNFQKNLTF